MYKYGFLIEFSETIPLPNVRVAKPFAKNGSTGGEKYLKDYEDSYVVYSKNLHLLNEYVSNP